LVAGAADGVPLYIKQFPNSPNEFNFVALIITSISTSLDRLQLREFLLPVTKHVGFDGTQLSNLPNGEISFSRNRRKLVRAGV